MAWQQRRECQLVAAERGWGCFGGCRGPALPSQGVLGAHTILGFSAYAQEFFLCPLPLPPLHGTLPWLLLDLRKGAPGSRKSCAPDLRPPGAWTGLFCPLPEPRAQAQLLPQGASLPPPYLHPSLTCFSPHRLYLGNPMDPPDLLSVELSTSRPTQHLGRVKSKSPQTLSPLVHQLPRKTCCLLGLP